MKGIVFDIKEFALNDGEGIRTTVFLKGCPLRCVWCHNPEGLSHYPELYIKHNGCINCGFCRVKCNHADCQPFGRCLHICPNDLVSVAGKEWDSDKLTEKLLKGSKILNESGGGITISGGEPLYQPDFTFDILERLKGKVHTAIETSGFANENTFKKIVSAADFVIMDIKIADAELHKRYTGVSNEAILKNAKWLINSNVPHLFRTPLIPTITDTKENLEAISKIVGNDKIELLLYNTLAPAKYRSVGLQFPSFIKESNQSVPQLSIFKNATLRK